MFSFNVSKFLLKYIFLGGGVWGLVNSYPHQVRLSFVGYGRPSVPVATDQLGNRGREGHGSGRLRKGCSLVLGPQADEMRGDSSPQATQRCVHLHYINVLAPLNSSGRGLGHGGEEFRPAPPFSGGPHKE